MVIQFDFIIQSFPFWTLWYVFCKNGTTVTKIHVWSILHLKLVLGRMLVERNEQNMKFWICILSQFQDFRVHESVNLKIKTCWPNSVMSLSMYMSEWKTLVSVVLIWDPTKIVKMYWRQNLHDIRLSFTCIYIPLLPEVQYWDGGFNAAISMPKTLKTHSLAN